MVHFRRLYWTRLLTIIVLTLSLMASTALASQLDDKRSQLNSVKANIQANKQKLNDAKQREAATLNAIKLSDEKVVQLQTELTNLQKELDQTTVKRQGVEAQLNETQKRLDAVQAELDSAQNKLSQRRMAYNKRINNIYMGGHQNVLEILLSSRNLADLLERTSFVNMVAENDAKLVLDMKQLTKTISDKVAEIDSQKRNLAKQRLNLVDEENHIIAVKNRIAANQKQFQDELNNQRALLGTIQKEKADLAAAEDMAEASARMLTDQIKALESGSRQVSRGYQRPAGRFTYPVNAPISSGYGWRYHPVLHYSRLHAGVDFAVGTGTPVHATASGRVIIAGWYGGYGYAVVIDHGGGFTSLYGHNSSLAVSAGSQVSQGQVISYSGSTGLSTGPHLHFEIRVNGNPVDPMKYL